ncbi:MAG: hypothetical protein IKL10_04730 [Clostridia bacterium]|nr:hypothetical protein [Clostridia bacterium]
MNKVILLEQLKIFTEKSVKDIPLPVKPQENDYHSGYKRTAEVYLMRLPDSSSAKKKAPYIIHQIITGKDSRKPGSTGEAKTVVRSIFCVYSSDEQEGSLLLLGLMERLRIDLLKTEIIGKQFALDLEEGVETLVYPDDTAPFYAGEMITSWNIPTVEREVSL